MNRKELKDLERSVTKLNPLFDILIKRQGFYFYFNEPNKKTKLLKVHKHFCGNCSYGIGKINGENGKNGVWIGPFENAENIKKFVKKYFTQYLDLLDFNCSCNYL